MLYNKFKDGYTQTSLGKLHFKQNEGSGEKIVLLHGLAASTRSFARLTEQLPADLNLYLVDLLGHGDSDAPKIDYTVGVQVLAVRELLEKAGITDSYLFGHSYGAWVAAAIAQDKYRGKGLVLEDAVGLQEFFDDLKRAGNEEQHKAELLKEALALGARPEVAKNIIDSEGRDEHLTRESLSSILRPTLILWGSEDKATDSRYAPLFAEYIKGSELEIVAGAGHVPHYTHAAKVSELLLKFIGYQE